MNYVKCRFLDENKIPKSREYIYCSKDDLAVGELALTDSGKEVVVTTVGVAYDEAKGFGGNLKSVSRPIEMPQTDKPMHEIIDAPQGEGADVVFNLPEISVNGENLAIVEQLPIIAEQLKVFSVEIDSIVEAVELMECNEGNRQIIKKYRQKINGLLSEFEKRRISIKNEINKPYEDFNADYKTYVSDKIRKALDTLDKRIATIEGDIKQNLKDDAEGYFYEYATSKDIEWLTWDKSGIKIGLSDNKTALRRDVKTFIDKVSDDLALIETQEHKAEIMVEYHKELNLSKAITTVQARVMAIAEQERKRVEREECLRQQEELRKQRAEELERAMQAKSNAPLPAPSVASPPVQQAPLGPPAVEPITRTYLYDSAEKQAYTIAFKIKNESKDRLAMLKKYIVDNGYDYEQVPLKNIMEG